VTYGTKGEPARCLVSVGPAITAKASSEGWRLRLRPNIYLYYSIVSELCSLVAKPKLNLRASLVATNLKGILAPPIPLRFLVPKLALREEKCS
jgi:hypothetical protein